MEQRRNWADPGRGEEIVYMGGPRIAHCKDYKTFFIASPEQTKKKNQATGKKKKKAAERFQPVVGGLINKDANIELRKRMNAQIEEVPHSCRDLLITCRPLRSYKLCHNTTSAS